MTALTDCLTDTDVDEYQVNPFVTSKRASRWAELSSLVLVALRQPCGSESDSDRDRDSDRDSDSNCDSDSDSKGRETPKRHRCSHRHGAIATDLLSPQNAQIEKRKS